MRCNDFICQWCGGRDQVWQQSGLQRCLHRVSVNLVHRLEEEKLSRRTTNNSADNTNYDCKKIANCTGSERKLPSVHIIDNKDAISLAILILITISTYLKQKVVRCFPTPWSAWSGALPLVHAAMNLIHLLSTKLSSPVPVYIASI